MKYIKQVFVKWLIFIFMVEFLIPPQGFCLSAKEEEELSVEFLKIAMQNYDIIKDPLITNYVNRVGQQVVSAFPPQDFKYHFYVIKDEVYNAFAGPGGHIFINSGLIDAMDNEDELAGILGHEISHVSCRHISEMVERSNKIGLATLAGIAVGIFLGIAGSGEAAGAVTLGSVAAGKSAALAYSRENEMQADQTGLKYLNKAGYSARGLLETLRKIRNKTWFGPNEIPTYLTTHPATEDRISYIGSWVENAEKVEPRNLEDTTSQFERVHTRLLAIYGDKSVALETFKSKLEAHPDDLMANYGYGLTLSRIGNIDDAIKYLRIALRKNAFDPYILKDLGKLYFLQGKYDEALNILKGGGDDLLYDPEKHFYLARTQMILKMYKDAVYTFEDLIAKDPDYPDAYRFLSETYYNLGRMGDSHYYLGIYNKNKGDMRNAEFHLKKALESINDESKKQEIKKMLKEIRRYHPTDQRQQENQSSLIGHSERPNQLLRSQANRDLRR